VLLVLDISGDLKGRVAPYHDEAYCFPEVDSLFELDLAVSTALTCIFSISSFKAFNSLFLTIFSSSANRLSSAETTLGSSPVIENMNDRLASCSRWANFSLRK